MRVPKSGVDALLVCLALMDCALNCGTLSITRPKSHPKYAAIWVGENFEAAKHKLSSTLHALHLARFLGRFWRELLEDP